VDALSFVSELTKEIKTFRRGGIHPPEQKDFAKDKPIEVMPAPSLIYIPMVQHIGAPCEPLVKKGDEVRVGQMIGKSEGFVSAPVHASVSGKVKQVALHAHPLGSQCMTVIIANDGKDEWDESVKPDGPQIPLDPSKGKDYLAAIRDGGQS
jgi:electron transport complex protein RnfC